MESPFKGWGSKVHLRSEAVPVLGLLKLLMISLYVFYSPLVFLEVSPVSSNHSLGSLGGLLGSLGNLGELDREDGGLDCGGEGRELCGGGGRELRGGRGRELRGGRVRVRELRRGRAELG